jgi:hypothetical protein
MIVFDLRCSNDHCFEGWFESSEAFQTQQEQAQIACPYCEDVNVEKALTPVAIKKKPSLSQTRDSFREAWFNFCHYVQDNFEDVGHDFAKEALKVHIGQSEERNIRGVTTESEEDMLKEEGVPFVKIPMPQQLDN